jgi:chorismate dehydratase
MLKLGHIVYANCYPPHAGILTQRVPFRVVEGIPTELNRLLYEGRIDVAPSSSIEYAMNPGRYLLLPDISITSKKKVMSILLESRVPIHELNRKVVALTTASATSIVLLRILLEVQHELEPGYTQYEQSVEDPAEQADAILSIGDLALTKNALPAFPHRYDLGELWHGFTGLPFVFGLWQVNYKKKNEQDLAALYDILVTSKAYGTSHLRELADSQAERFSIAADRLYEYWESFSYDLGTEEQKGLLAFYKYAAQINVIEPVTDLRFWTKS